MTKREIYFSTRNRLAVLALFLLCFLGAKAQTDYSGIYYIGSAGYNASTPANNYYLCPTEGWCFYAPDDDYTGTDNGKPFLTTYQCRNGEYDATKAVWTIEKAPEPNSNYYYIKQTNTGKYLLSNGQINTSTNPDRIRVHLEEVADPSAFGDKVLFDISPYSTYLVIRPIGIIDGNELDHDNANHTTHRWLTVNGGNKPSLKGEGNKGGGPGSTNDKYRYTTGIVGIYIQNDANAKFYLEDYITRPTINYNSEYLIEITSAQTGNVTIKYTTDGTTPSATNGETYTDPFDVDDDVTIIKAVTIIGEDVSNVATFQPIVLLGPNHKRLIQSQNNAWNTTDFHFYMIPGDEANNVTKVNTTSLFRPSMEWYFLNAGVESGVQYYYIVNNANGKYLCYDATNIVYMEDFSNDDKFKFKIVESPTLGTCNIYPYGLNILINKATHNANSGPINTVNYSTSNANSGNTRWKFILPNELDRNNPFDVSTPSSQEYSYYKIANVGDNTHYIVPGNTNATTSNVSDTTMNWYFEVAQAADASDWLTYFHIRNALTGDYLYFTKNANNAGACLVMCPRIDTITSGNEDRCLFTWAKTADENANYYIIPKKLKDVSQNQFSALRKHDNNTSIITNLTRGAGRFAWTFEPSNYKCAQPVISLSAGSYEITATESDAKIYYKIGAGELTPSPETLYSGPISVADLDVESTTIRAIAARNSDGTDASDIASVTVYRVDTPQFTTTEDGKVLITCDTVGVTIHYEMGNPGDVNTPTTSSPTYVGPIENAAGLVIKALAEKGGLINSPIATSNVIVFTCATPVIRKTSPNTFTITCSFPSSDVQIYYNTGDGSQADPTNTTGTPYQDAVTFNPTHLPFTVKARAYADNYTPSAVAIQELTIDLTQDDDGYYIIASNSDFGTFVSMVNENTTNAGAKYKITADINASSAGVIDQNPFTGELKSVAKADGSFPVVSNLSHAIFNTVNGGTVKNVMLDNVNISSGTNVGAICNEATGDTRIYNCGVLGGSVGGSGYVGSLVGLLDGNSRVINCYSYATITGGSDVGGIVGYNNYASNATDIQTMVMNCMFYGDITDGTNKSPVYGGNNIANLQGGLNTFNYYAYEKLPTSHITDGKYNSALAAEDRYLNRFEFYRLLLNSNKKLAAFYATGSVDNAEQKMLKWVLETADRTNSNPYPYPILKEQGYYPSIINPDFANAPDSIAVGPNKGGKLGKTLSVTISGVGSNAPTGASITTGSLTLQRTDKDFDRFNFNYDKVQLPYYNDVGEGNYTGNRVVTGWKITSITAVDDDPYLAANYDYSKVYSGEGEDPGYFDYPNYNFADRKSSNKDLFSVSGRVFSQGAYFDVPYGVTSITIEPYWAKAWYIADPNYDVVYKDDYSGKQNVTQTGTQVNNPLGSNPTLFNGQRVETSITRALDSIANRLGGLGSTVYDNALVLVGNLHLDVVPLNGDRPFTMMSVDSDNDHEPDYCLIYHHKNRSNITPIRFDFLTVPGTAQAQKPNGATLVCNFTIFKTRGWFEVTNTAFMYSNQLEYENGDLGTGVTKINAPLILLGGIFDQFVSTQSSSVDGRTIYIHLGGNLWIDQFGMGTHGDGSKSTPHVPVSVTGGDYVGFYLTGTYNKDADVKDDNAECYISGGRFAELAGACQEQIGVDNTTKGNVHWQIYNADITEFFGGGINDAKPVKGNITTDIFNSRVGTFCGGPKFGNMAANKTVTTTAEGCTFNKFFGAGYGGLSYAKKKYYDKDGSQNWTTLQGYYITDRGKYFDGSTTGSSQISGKDYGKKGPGVATDFAYEFFVWSTGTTGARFYVKFASFSLAQCNDVESTLKKCTINENFYGGGSLGKVVGEITSILENCTVKGNVFGAGFSATLPTIEVRDAGFTTNPNFNSASGMFEPGVFSGTTTFTWQHKDDYPPNNSAGFLTDEGNYDIQNGTSVVTTVDLSKSNLGSVSGNVELILKGNTTVGTLNSGGSLQENTGNVYGGGDESHVTQQVNNQNQPIANTGNTTVILQGKAHVLGNVYGGGNEGPVGGNSSVIFEPEPYIAPSSTTDDTSDPQD